MEDNHRRNVSSLNHITHTHRVSPKLWTLHRLNYTREKYLRRVREEGKVPARLWGYPNSLFLIRGGAVSSHQRAAREYNVTQQNQQKYT